MGKVVRKAVKKAVKKAKRTPKTPKVDKREAVIALIKVAAYRLFDRVPTAGLSQKEVEILTDDILDAV